jgi:hypothetical protein
VNDSLRSVDPAAWSSTGVLSPGASGLTASDPNGGSLISRVPIPGGDSEAEVAINITLTSSGGTYTAFLQSSPDARTGNAHAGWYLAFEMQNPQFDASHNCMANFVLLQSATGKASLIAAFSHSCRNGMRMRMVVHNGTVLVWPDQTDAMEFNIGASGTGQPGIGFYGVPAGNAIALVQLGAIDRTAPSAVDSKTFKTSVFRKRVELKWSAAADDPNGVGTAGYWVYRDGLYLARTSIPYFVDETVVPGDTHTYSVRTLDDHFNFAAATTASVTVPKEQLTPITAPPPATIPTVRPGTRGPAPRVTAGTPQADSGGGLDPRRIGVRVLGSYWGGGGEAIDSISGNLNFTIGLLNPQNRNGAAIPFQLSYNSQIWRNDGSGITFLGQDTGFGMGWKLQAGSITPVWTTSMTIDHYLYTDSTGAEYSLSVNNGNIWTSVEGVYASFDANFNNLYFPDGSYW